MTQLSGKQRKRLRGLAHGLRPVVYVGARGLTDAVMQQLDAVLERHELIKVRIEMERSERQAIVTRIEESTGAASAGLVGKVAILYRAHPNQESRRVRLSD